MLMYRPVCAPRAQKAHQEQMSSLTSLISSIALSMLFLMLSWTLAVRMGNPAPFVLAAILCAGLVIHIYSHWYLRPRRTFSAMIATSDILEVNDPVLRGFIQEAGVIREALLRQHDDAVYAYLLNFVGSSGDEVPRNDLPREIADALEVLRARIQTEK